MVCVDPTRVDPAHAGALWDPQLLRKLPPEVDPCGERGEFHTLITNGPMFAAPLNVHPGDVTELDGFVYADFTVEPRIDP